MQNRIQQIQRYMLFDFMLLRHNKYTTLLSSTGTPEEFSVLNPQIYLGVFDDTTAGTPEEFTIFISFFIVLVNSYGVAKSVLLFLPPVETGGYV